MGSKVILKKQKASENEGHLAIQHFHFNKKKIISLKERISVEDFVTHFNPIKNRFNRTTMIDYKKFNNLIKLNINNLNCFGVSTTKNSTSFIDYFDKEIDIQSNQKSLGVRKSILKIIKNFKTHKKLEDISFEIIDYYFIKELKNFIRLTHEGSTTKAYMDVIKTVLNRAKKDLLYIEKYNYFEGIDYRITYSNNSALTKDEVQKLLNVEDDKYIYVLRMFLIGIFLNGLRVSDLLFLKNEDFGKDNITYHTKKKNKKMSIRYGDKLVTLLMFISDIPTLSKTNNINLTIDKIIDDVEAQNNKNEKYGATQRLISHIQSLPKKDLFFKEFVEREPVLLKYNKRFEMNELENKAYNRLVAHYGYILKKIAKKYDIAKITSHTSRYTFATLSLGVEHPDVNAISSALGHRSLTTTMDYFNKNFGKERVDKLTRDFNSEFIL